MDKKKIRSIISRLWKRKTDAVISDDKEPLFDREKNTNEKRNTEISLGESVKQLFELGTKMDELRNDVLITISEKISGFEDYEKRLNDLKNSIDELKRPVKEKEGSANSDLTPVTGISNESKDVLGTVNTISNENSPKTWNVDWDSIKNALPELYQVLSTIKKIRQEGKDRLSEDEIEKFFLSENIIRLMSGKVRDPLKFPDKSDKSLKELIKDAIPEAAAIKELSETLERIPEELKQLKIELLYLKGVELLKWGTYPEAKKCFKEITNSKMNLYLFSIDGDTQLEGELNNETILEKMKNEFKTKKGIALSERASLKKEDKEWKIADGKKIYVIKKDGEKLDIYMNSTLKGAWLNRGVAYGESGEIEDEIDCYNIALEIDENYEKAQHNMNIAKRKLKRAK